MFYHVYKESDNKLVYSQQMFSRVFAFTKIWWSECSMLPTSKFIIYLKTSKEIKIYENAFNINIGVVISGVFLPSVNTSNRLQHKLILTEGYLQNCAILCIVIYVIEKCQSGCPYFLPQTKLQEGNVFTAMCCPQ